MSTLCKDHFGNVIHYGDELIDVTDPDSLTKVTVEKDEVGIPFPRVLMVTDHPAYSPAGTLHWLANYLADAEKRRGKCIKVKE